MGLCQGDDGVLGCWVMATHDGFIFFDAGSTASHAEQHGAPRDPVCNCLHNKDPREQALKFNHLHQIPQICFQAQAGGVWPKPLISCLTHTHARTHACTHTHTHTVLYGHYMWSTRLNTICPKTKLAWQEQHLPQNVLRYQSIVFFCLPFSLLISL